MYMYIFPISSVDSFTASALTQLFRLFLSSSDKNIKWTSKKWNQFTLNTNC